LNKILGLLLYIVFPSEIPLISQDFHAQWITES